MVTISQEYSLLRVALGSSGTSYDVILISSGVRIEFAISVTFLERVSGRGESGGSTRIEVSRRERASEIGFVTFIVLAEWGWILKGEERVQTQNILKNYVLFMQTGLEPKDPRQSRL
jgi:hypothetical protein